MTGKKERRTTNNNAFNKVEVIYIYIYILNPLMIAQFPPSTPQGAATPPTPIDEQSKREVTDDLDDIIHLCLAMYIQPATPVPPSRTVVVVVVVVIETLELEK